MTTSASTTIEAPRPQTHAIRVWDWPVRLTHWSFVALIPAMYLTAENSEWGWHVRLGHVLLALLIFRVLWGFVGTDTARFAHFVKGPRAVLDYLRGRYDYKRNKGHSPLAALSVLTLLGLMFAQVGMGLFAGDPYDGATGPLNPLVGVMMADTITDTHEWFYYVIFAMIGLHIIAIGVIGAMQATSLIGPMIGGKAEKAPSVEANQPTPWGRALAVFAVSAAIAGWVYVGAPPLT
ncbi:cytochrome b/b6 domain-containing protein [Erythrobacter sp.]|jgi:cytochrome b|uniref:cytochrome b/b6 domain-containing protein n=1 Tax=Erythrobacter sp. TaxID=1042 RepID=UPI002EC42B29|nr:cytochrome b/b6 domain-containing protein [Erythrobacter sp.]